MEVRKNEAVNIAGLWQINREKNEIEKFYR